MPPVFEGAPHQSQRAGIRLSLLFFPSGRLFGIDYNYYYSDCYYLINHQHQAAPLYAFLPHLLRLPPFALGSVSRLIPCDGKTTCAHLVGLPVPVPDANAQQFRRFTAARASDPACENNDF